MVLVEVKDPVQNCNGGGGGEGQWKLCGGRRGRAL